MRTYIDRETGGDRGRRRKYIETDMRRKKEAEEEYA